MSFIEDMAIKLQTILGGASLQTAEERATIEEEALSQSDESGIEVPVESSWIDSGEYNVDTKTLMVNLDSGATYVYYNVPQRIAEEFFDAPSKGKFLNDILKRGFFPYSEI